LEFLSEGKFTQRYRLVVVTDLFDFVHKSNNTL